MQIPGAALAAFDDPEDGKRPFFIARQPIYNRRRRLDAYELLFRGSESATGAAFLDGNAATAQLITHGTWLGDFRSLSGGKPVFVNFTRDLLLADPASLLPSKQFVVEVLEDVEPEPGMLAACRALRAAGYRVALDDVIDVSRVEAFRGAIDIVKVDLLAASWAAINELADAAKATRVKLLAEKVEDDEVLEFTMQLGFDYFQGYFLSRPESVKRSTLPGLQPAHIRLLDVVNRPELNIDDVASAVEADPSLTYMLLRRANSVARALNRRVSSVRDVVVLFGQDEIRRAATFVVMGAIVGQSEHLLHDSVTRARFCDHVGERLGLPPRERFSFYMTGLLSTIDALLDQPLEEALDLLPLPNAVKAALLNEIGHEADALKLASAYMSANWPEVSRLAAKLAIQDDDLTEVYLEAVRSSDEAMASSDNAA